MKSMVLAAMAAMMVLGAAAGSAAAAADGSTVKFDGRSAGREYYVIWTAYGCFGTKGGVTLVCDWKKVGVGTQSVSYKFKAGTTKRRIMTVCRNGTLKHATTDNGATHTLEEGKRIKVGKRMEGDEKTCWFSR